MHSKSPEAIRQWSTKLFIKMPSALHVCTLLINVYKYIQTYNPQIWTGLHGSDGGAQK